MLNTTGSRMERLPLQGVRVTDFTWAAVGGYCSLVWAMLGAECLKVETSTRPEFTRARAPSAPRMAARRAVGGLNELSVNKRSITLNLKEPQAIELIKMLVSVSDMVGENFRPGVLERAGLGYETLRRIKPDLVYVEMSAGGSFGPDKFDSGYAGVFAAMSGISSLMGYAGGPPVELRYPSDISSGAMGAFVSIAALLCRQRTGVGQCIDIANRETLGSFVGDAFLDYFVNGRVQSRQGNRHPAWAPHNVYPCAGEHEGGRWISIAVTNQEEWKALVKVMGDPPWAQQERFGDPYQRWVHQAELDELISQWTRTYTDVNLMVRLQDAGVPAMPTFYPEDLVANPHLAARNVWERVRLPDSDESALWFGAPWKFSKTPCSKAIPPPDLGEANHSVFVELLGLTEGQVRRLVANGVIV